MARPKRSTTPTSALPRTIERIAIAAIAAIATRGSGEGVTTAAITIFCIVVIVEELSRRWVWHGKRVTLRDVALSTVGELRIWRAEYRRSRNRRSRRTRVRAQRSAGNALRADSARRKLQE